MLPFPRLERSGSPAANKSDWNQKRGNATLLFKGTGLGQTKNIDWFLELF
jgi:hypothetical protein